MHGRRTAALSVGLALLLAVCFTWATAGSVAKSQDTPQVSDEAIPAGDFTPADLSAAESCGTKHCPPNTHCCYSCSGSPICVKNGVMCPECAPR